MKNMFKNEDICNLYYRELNKTLAPWEYETFVYYDIFSI